MIYVLAWVGTGVLSILIGAGFSYLVEKSGGDDDNAIITFFGVLGMALIVIGILVSPLCRMASVGEYGAMRGLFSTLDVQKDAISNIGVAIVPSETAPLFDAQNLGVGNSEANMMQSFVERVGEYNKTISRKRAIEEDYPFWYHSFNKTIPDDLIPITIIFE